MLCNLVLAFTSFDIRDLHPVEVEMQLFACLQTFLSTIPIPKLDPLRLRLAKLTAPGALDAFREIEGELIGRMVSRQQLSLHPAVKLRIREFALAQIVIDLSRVLNAATVVGKVLLSNRFAKLPCGRLLVDLAYFIHCSRGLLDPFFATSLKASDQTGAPRPLICVACHKTGRIRGVRG